MATSLVVHNTGLPIAVLISFVWVVGGVTVGLALIQVHKVRMERKVAAEIDRLFLLLSIQNKTKEEDCDPHFEAIFPNGFEHYMKNAKKLISKNRSWSARMFSYKAAHGVFMFVSFINMFGRMFGSNQSGDFTCHTYPYYKQVDSPKFKGLNRSLSPVPLHDPDYSQLPWAHGLHWWGLELSVGPILFALSLGGCVAYYNCSVYTSATAMVALPGSNLIEFKENTFSRK
jgi:hypothetical protein